MFSLCLVPLFAAFLTDDDFETALPPGREGA
jgi:hypothetical protein